MDNECRTVAVRKKQALLCPLKFKTSWQTKQHDKERVRPKQKTIPYTLKLCTTQTPDRPPHGAATRNKNMHNDK